MEMRRKPRLRDSPGLHSISSALRGFLGFLAAARVCAVLVGGVAGAQEREAGGKIAL